MGIPVGPHLVEIEGDVIIVRQRGDFELAHMKEWCRIADGVIAEYGGAFTISDFTVSGDFPPESRRYGSEWQNSAKVFGSALFGSSLAQRVLMTMIVRVGSMFRKHPGSPLVSVASEAEARAWVAELRKKLGVPEPSKKPKDQTS